MFAHVKSKNNRATYQVNRSAVQRGVERKCGEIFKDGYGFFVEEIRVKRDGIQVDYV